MYNFRRSLSQEGKKTTFAGNPKYNFRRKVQFSQDKTIFAGKNF